MSLEFAAIILVVIALATAWLIAKDKSIQEDNHAADAFSKHIEEHRNLAERKGFVSPDDKFRGPVVFVLPGKKQARRKRSKANSRRKAGRSKGARK